ncbi:synaptopodin-2 [Sardina pilchardus]|uniref:synaptopodin-2 n=1 Tax=Sardina pilchardus TaxID=27697 RepID=UPI002E1208D0
MTLPVTIRLLCSVIPISVACPLQHCFSLSSTPHSISLSLSLSLSLSVLQVVSRSVSLSPPARLPLLVRSARSVSSSPVLAAAPGGGARAAQRPPAWPERANKPPSPWEAASRHPLGLVDEAFAFQNLQQSLASSVKSAANRKQLPTPPPEWTARVAYEAPPRSLSSASSMLSRTYSSSLSRSHTPPRSPQPFLSPTKSSASAPASGALYSASYRQTPPLRSLTEVSLGPPWARPSPAQTHAQGRYRSSYTWRR